MTSVKTRPYSDENRWVTIYPAFINSKRTKEQGRRIPSSKGVDNPTPQEIFEILNFEGLKVRIEKGKMHPRDPERNPVFVGRIRVQLKNDDGELCNVKFPTRKSLMLHAATLIPKLKSRQPGGGGQQQSAASSSGAAPGGGGGGKKKKR